jgi:DNA modification methylase
VITSSPYARQRDGKYEGISEEAYPQWFCTVMEALRPKLTVDGSVLVVIRSHLESGRVSQYVMRTRLAIQDAGWIECEELIWYKPDGPPLGSIKRPRRAWENILWYSTIEQPYVDLKACGKPSQRIGLESSNPHDNIDGTNVAIEGIARVTDVFSAAAGDVDPGVTHPAIYPPSLVSQLIRTFAPPGSVILDPFVGSGTTCLVAQSEDYDFIGFDSEQRYVDLANRRLKTEAKYFRGVSKLEREQAKDVMFTRAAQPVTMPTSKTKAISPWP